jgi:hypothetical protein
MLSILAYISEAGGDDVAAVARAADESGETWPIPGTFEDALVLVKQVYLPVVNKLPFASSAERWRLSGALFRLVNINMYRATGGTADRAMRTVLASNEPGWGLPALVGAAIDGAAVLADECRPEAQEVATGRATGALPAAVGVGGVGSEPADDAVDVREVDEWWARDEAFDAAADAGWTLQAHPAPPAGTWWDRHPHSWTAYLDTVSVTLSVLEIAAAREDEFLARWRIARRPPAGVARLGALVVSASAAHISPYALVVALAALVDPVWPANIAGRAVRLLAVLDRPPRVPVAAGVPAALEGARALGKLQRACRQWLVSPASVAVYESGEVYLDVRAEIVAVLAEGSRRPTKPLSLSHALRADALDPVLQLLRSPATEADLRAGCAEFLAACVTDARSWRDTLRHLRLHEEQEETLLLHRVVAQEHGAADEAWLRTVAAVLRVAAADAVLAHEEAHSARGSSTRGETKGLAAANARIARLCSLVTGRPALMPAIFSLVLDSIRQPNAEHEYAFTEGDEIPSPSTGISVRAAADALRTSHAAQMTQDQLVAQIDWSACTLVAGSPFLPASLARQVHVFDVPLLHDQLRRRVVVLRDEGSVPQPELLDALVVLCLRRATARNAHSLLLAAQRSCMSQWVQAVWALSEPAPRPLTASLGAGDMYDDAGEERLATHLLEYLQAIVSALSDPAIEMSEVEDGQEAEHPLDVAARAAGLLVERIVGLQEARRARHAARPGCQEDELLPLPTAVLSSVFRGLAEAAARGATLTRRALCAAALLSHARLLRSLSTTMLHTNVAAAISTSWGAKLIDTLAADVASVVGTGADWRSVSSAALLAEIGTVARTLDMGPAFAQVTRQAHAGTRLLDGLVESVSRIFALTAEQADELVGGRTGRHRVPDAPAVVSARAARALALESRLSALVSLALTPDGAADLVNGTSLVADVGECLSTWDLSGSVDTALSENPFATLGGTAERLGSSLMHLLLALSAHEAVALRPLLPLCLETMAVPAVRAVTETSSASLLELVSVSMGLASACAPYVSGSLAQQFASLAVEFLTKKSAVLHRRARFAETAALTCLRSLLEDETPLYAFRPTALLPLAKLVRRLREESHESDSAEVRALIRRSLDQALIVLDEHLRVCEDAEHRTLVTRVAGVQ